jgi:hypothetical protein
MRLSRRQMIEFGNYLSGVRTRFPVAREDVMEVFFVWGMMTVSKAWALLWERRPIEYLMNNFRASLTQGRLILVSLSLWILSQHVPRCGGDTPTRSEDVLLPALKRWFT